MTRYRLLEILGVVIRVAGAVLIGLGWAIIIDNLFNLWVGDAVTPWARLFYLLPPGIALYAAGRAIGKVGERHLQQPVHEQV